MNTISSRFNFAEKPKFICGGRVYSEGLGFGTVIGYKHGEVNSRVYILFDNGERRSVKAATGVGIHNDVPFYVFALEEPVGWRDIVWPVVWFCCGGLSFIGAVSGRLW